MPKLPPLTSQQVIKLIERKGFILDRTKGRHHIYYNPENKKRVVVPFHKKDRPKGTLHEILKQTGIGRDEIQEIMK